MTKDVLITIRGVHTLDHEDNDVEMIVRGDYYQKNGKHYILYEEILEGAEERVKNVIKISPSSMDIIKKGVTNSRMLFEKNKKNSTYYRTPYGQMLLDVNTRELEIQVTEDEIDVRIEYELDVNHEPMADCRIKMNIMSRSNGSFSVLG